MEVRTKFENILNIMEWGKEVKPSQWKVPVDAKKILRSFIINNDMARRLVE